MILDSLGMFDAAAAFPEQLARALDVSRRALEHAVLPAHDDIANVVLLGTGGAGFAASLVLEATGPTIPVPIVVHRGFGVPNFVDQSSLVIAISFDGETGETLEAAQDASADGATVICVSKDGALQHWADAHGLVHLPVMADAPVDRAAIGSLSVPVLLLLERVGLYPGPMPGSRLQFLKRLVVGINSLPRKISPAVSAGGSVVLFQSSTAGTAQGM